MACLWSSEKIFLETKGLGENYRTRQSVFFFPAAAAAAVAAINYPSWTHHIIDDYSNIECKSGRNLALSLLPLSSFVVLSPNLFEGFSPSSHQDCPSINYYGIENRKIGSPLCLSAFFLLSPLCKLGITWKGRKQYKQAKSSKERVGKPFT